MSRTFMPVLRRVTTKNLSTADQGMKLVRNRLRTVKPRSSRDRYVLPGTSWISAIGMPSADNAAQRYPTTSPRAPSHSPAATKAEHTTSNQIIDDRFGYSVTEPDVQITRP